MPGVAQQASPAQQPDSPLLAGTPTLVRSVMLGSDKIHDTLLFAKGHVRFSPQMVPDS